MNPAIVICSRKESSRIPEKAFKKIAGLPAIEHILSRCKKSGILTVLAVPKNQFFDYEPIATKYGAKMWAGNAESPLHRIADFLRRNKDITHIVRITHDDILIDIPTMKDMLETAKNNPKVGYIYCPNIVDGAGVEVICRENILHAAKHHGPTEYISYFVRGKGLPKEMSIGHFPRPSVSRNYRLTMDYSEDWQVLNIVMRQVGKNATLDKVCSFLDQHTELLSINQLPTVTFYTCARNAGATIGKTIASVLNCGLDNFEYIVVDDGSTDNTVMEVAKFSRDKRLKLVVNEQNRGLASSSNIAVALSRGKYVMRVDADDIIIPSAFHEAFYEMAKALHNGAAIVYPAYYEIGQTNRPNKVIKGDENRHAGCALMLRSALNEMRFRDGIRHWDGLELYKRVSKKGDAVAYFDYPIWFYRVHKSSMSNTKKETRARLLISLGLDGLKVVK